MSASLEEQVIAAIASKTKLPAGRMTAETTFAELGIDSLAAIELVFKFEDAFDITIPDGAVREMRTVADVTAALRAALATGVPSAP